MVDNFDDYFLIKNLPKIFLFIPESFSHIVATLWLARNICVIINILIKSSTDIFRVA